MRTSCNFSSYLQKLLPVALYYNKMPRPKSQVPNNPCKLTEIHRTNYREQSYVIISIVVQYIWIEIALVCSMFYLGL